MTEIFSMPEFWYAFAAGFMLTLAVGIMGALNG